ncbi:hypothetical protein [Paraburkholderia sp. D1E]|uniref:hypothetical protein n=1 Tax=Paraburkholderia sp. D1E TaxID=3461398 RepID=UPI004045D06B
MAEANSIQMAKLAATPSSKLQSNERHGVRRLMFGQINSISAAIGDTIYFGRIPKAARICGVRLNNAAGTASSTLAIGLRKTFDKTVIAASGLAAATAINAAGNADVTTGTLVVTGLSYITQDEVDVYGTIAGAVTPGGGQLIAVAVDYVTD